MSNLPKKLQLKLTKRTATNTFRKLPEENNQIDFASNDYLGFAKEVVFSHEALQLMAENNVANNGATGSRLLTGNHLLYKKLELRLVELLKSEAALVFNSGYDANIGFFSSVPQRGDFVFYDELIHASIRDGIQLGNAKSYRFKHNNLDDLKLVFERSRNAIENSENTAMYLVTEAVFSMDGDGPNLKKLADFCAKNKIHLIVDEAHSFGVCGKNGMGLVNLMSLENQVFARIITFSKALGCHGAAIIGSASLIAYLVNFARSFMYTTALPPHAIASIIIALEFLTSRHGKLKIEELNANIDFFRAEIERISLCHSFVESYSAIQCALVPSNEKAKFVAQQLKEKGFNVKPILSPTVPEGKERLRFCIHSYNSKAEIFESLRILAKFR